MGRRRREREGGWGPKVVLGQGFTHLVSGFSGLSGGFVTPAKARIPSYSGLAPLPGMRIREPILFQPLAYVFFTVLGGMVPRVPPLELRSSQAAFN